MTGPRSSASRMPRTSPTDTRVRITEPQCLRPQWQSTCFGCEWRSQIGSDVSVAPETETRLMRQILQRADQHPDQRGHRCAHEHRRSGASDPPTDVPAKVDHRTQRDDLRGDKCGIGGDESHAGQRKAQGGAVCRQQDGAGVFPRRPKVCDPAGWPLASIFSQTSA